MVSWASMDVSSGGGDSERWLVLVAGDDDDSNDRSKPRAWNSFLAKASSSRWNACQISSGVRQRRFGGGRAGGAGGGGGCLRLRYRGGAAGAGLVGRDGVFLAVSLCRYTRWVCSSTRHSYASLSRLKASSASAETWNDEQTQAQHQQHTCFLRSAHGAVQPGDLFLSGCTRIAISLYRLETTRVSSSAATQAPAFLPAHLRGRHERQPGPRLGQEQHIIVIAA